jgi:transposase
MKLDWHIVKELDKQYMRAQLAKAPMVIGIDEISVRKGHDYRFGDLVRGRAIWLFGIDRSEASMAKLYQ